MATPLRLLSLHHVPFEGLGSIAQWIAQRGHHHQACWFCNDDALPPLRDVDAIIVMGGPMNVDEEASFPWLAVEKSYLADAMCAGKPILGICLGAQLIARVLGADVRLNPEREIGWFPVHRIVPGGFFRDFPREFQAFHWHGETFDLPVGAEALLESEACRHQAFAVEEGRYLALQFHLEMTLDGARALAANCPEDLRKAHYVQPIEAILSSPYYETAHALMERVLDRWSAFAKNAEKNH